MQITSIKTITELSQLNGRVYVHLSTDELAEQFMRQAEAEGFTFGDGVKPTERCATAVMAVNPDHTINYVGATGHMAFGAGVRAVSGSPLLRFSYEGNRFIRYEKSSMKEKWQRLFSEDDSLLYEGFTYCGKPCGAGTAYFPNGMKYQEGIFGVKGLHVGREYYPNGNIRFEGAYHLNCAYGPNYPSIGTVYGEDGARLYQGLLSFQTSGLGYPLKARQVEYGKVVQDGHPQISWLMWADSSNGKNE